MKTYYFSGYWEEPWECGDGCCTGGGEWHINFVRLVENEKDVEWEQCWFGTSREMSGPWFQVYEEEYDTYVPDHIYEAEEKEAIQWVKEKLAQKDVFVVVDIEE